MKNNFIMDIVSLTLLVGMLSTKSFGQIALTKTNIIRLKQSTDNEMTVGEYATNTDDVQPEDEEECICTPYYLCRTANESSQVGDGIIDVRINLAPRCSSYMDVCCKNGMITQPIKNNPNQNNNYNNNENNNHNNNDNNNNNKHHNNDNDNNNNNGNNNNNNNNGNNNNNNNNGNNNNNNDNDNTGNNNNNNNNNNDNDNSGNNNNNNNNNNDNDNTGNNNNNNGNNNNNNNNGNNNDNNHNDNNNNNHNNNNVKECVCNDKGQGTLSTIIKNESGGSSNYNKPESNGHETENNIICSPDKEHCYPDSTYPGELKCGIWNKVGVGFRVINTIGGESQYGEFPSMVAIFKVEESANGEKKLLYHCGGSLIETNVVLTAAHCVIRKDISTFIVRAGEWDLKTEKEIYTHQDREVSKIVTHKEYYSGGLHNDVALIFTEKPFSLQKHIQLVCLPEENDVYDETLCYSSGWGMDVSHNNYTIVKKTKHGISKEIGQYEYNILKNVDLPIVPREECTKALKSTRLGAKFILHESFICAGGVQGKDTCKGDGGSPLVCPSKNDPNSLVQVGIVSWGVDCGLEKIPGLYVNVAKFRKWIDNEIAHYQTGTNNER